VPRATCDGDRLQLPTSLDCSGQAGATDVICLRW
jgi:hypothetical protein